MSHLFKNGDKVTVRPGFTSITGHTRDPEEIRTVTSAERYGGQLLLNFTANGSGNIFEPEALKLVETAPDTIDISQVLPGDKVTLEHADGSRIVDREVNSVYAVLMGKRQEYLNDLHAAGWVVTDHQPGLTPKPRPGTFGTALVDGQLRHGVIDEDGDFDYKVWDGELVGDHYATPNNFANFKPYSEGE